MTLSKISHYLQASFVGNIMVFCRISADIIFHMNIDQPKDMRREGYVSMNMMVDISDENARVLRDLLLVKRIYIRCICI